MANHVLHDSHWQCCNHTQRHQLPGNHMEAIGSTISCLGNTQESKIRKPWRSPPFAVACARVQLSRAAPTAYTCCDRDFLQKASACNFSQKTTHPHIAENKTSIAVASPSRASWTDMNSRHVTSNRLVSAKNCWILLSMGSNGPSPQPLSCD